MYFGLQWRHRRFEVLSFPQNARAHFNVLWKFLAEMSIDDKVIADWTLENLYVLIWGGHVERSYVATILFSHIPLQKSCQLLLLITPPPLTKMTWNSVRKHNLLLYCFWDFPKAFDLCHCNFDDIICKVSVPIFITSGACITFSESNVPLKLISCKELHNQYKSVRDWRLIQASLSLSVVNVFKNSIRRQWMKVRILWNSSWISTHAFRLWRAKFLSAKIRETNWTPNLCTWSMKLSYLVVIYLPMWQLKGSEEQRTMSEHLSWTKISLATSEWKSGFRRCNAQKKSPEKQSE